MKLITILIIFILIHISSTNNIEHFNKITLSGTGTKKYIIDRNQIFPLKKYKFYDYYIYGPNKIDYIKKHYGNDVFTHGVLQYSNNKKKFKLVDFEPAKINKEYNGCTKNTKRCEFWEKENYRIPPCCARKLNNLLKHTIKILKKYNIRYFCYWGTLIGSIRHKGIIPWDTDIDIYISKNDLINIKNNNKIINELQKRYHQIEFESNNLFRLNFSKKNKQHVDVYAFE